MKKKILAFFLCAAILLSLACSGSAGGAIPANKYGFAPYALSKEEAELLEYFAIENTSQLLSFKAPKEATAVWVNIYRLGANGQWSRIDSGGLDFINNTNSKNERSGVFAMRLYKDHTIECHISAGGRFSVATNTSETDGPGLSTAYAFLTQFQQAGLNEEVPVAMILNSADTSAGMAALLNDFSEPSGLAGLDLVQAVTLTFTNSKV
ncbi:MAG: hypothetical protein LBS36_12160 [Oscillospiraceae bacterium]|nr:hypothetical protein [Oscillospiraceae bacterium]